VAARVEPDVSESRRQRAGRLLGLLHRIGNLLQIHHRLCPPSAVDVALHRRKRDGCDDTDDRDDEDQLDHCEAAVASHGHLFPPDHKSVLHVDVEQLLISATSNAESEVPTGLPVATTGTILTDVNVVPGETEAGVMSTKLARSPSARQPEIVTLDP